MTNSMNALIERQILKAQAEGQLNNLSGAGKPLKRTYVIPGGGASVSKTIKAGIGVPKSPAPLKEQIDAARSHLAREIDPEAKKALVAEIAKLEMAYNIEREAYLNFMK